MSNFLYDLSVQGLAAFYGAFFAFLFLRLGVFFSKLYKRQVKHYNSLVNLEVQLNVIGGIIHDNLYILPNFRKTIVAGNIYFNNLHKLPIDKSHYEKLYDIDLLNELYSYNYNLRKINDDIESVGRGYRDIKNALIQEHIKRNDYILNAQLMSEKLLLIEFFLKKLQGETVKLLAKVRLQAKADKPLGTKLQSWFINPIGSKLSKEKIKKEVKKLKKEIKETQKQSRKQIDETLKKYNIRTL